MDVESEDAGWREALRRRGRWLDEHPAQFRAAVAAGLLLCSFALFPYEHGYRAESYRLGTIQPRAVIADFDFPINKDPRVLESEQDESAARVPPVFVMRDSVTASVRRSFEAFSSVVNDLRRGRYRDDETPPEGDPARRLSQRVVLALLGSTAGPALMAEAEERLNRYLEEGIVDSVDEQALGNHARVGLRGPEGEWVGPPSRFYGPHRIETEILRDDEVPESVDRGVLSELVLAYARPNVARDREATAARIRLARESVPTTIGMVLKGEKIIGAHERVTAEALRKLESYEYWKQQRIGDRPLLGQSIASWIGRLLLFSVCLAALGAYLAAYQPGVFRSKREVTFVGSLLGFFILASGLVINTLELSAFLLPISAAAVLFTLVFQPRLAVVAALFLVVAIGLVADLGLAFMVVLGSGVVAGVLGVRALRERREMYRMVFYVACAHAVTLLAVSLAQTLSWQVFAHDLIWVVANPVISAALAFLAVPLVEGFSGRCTNMTLLELQDLNRPLLKRLMLEAPGTYHHSLMVGALAESAAHAVGANDLLARVLGYYHDIGKLSKPEYFQENLSPGQKNPHDRLAPTMSRLILEGHVREGVELARAERLPLILQRGISEHHGGTVMRYFLVKARKQTPGVSEDDYRYPYPRPSFRESAIVLLADAADAASRSLEDPLPSRIRELVQSILYERVRDGTLDQSGLSLDDLAKVRDGFVPILAALFQGRPAYPPLGPVSSESSRSGQREDGPAPAEEEADAS